MPKDEETHKILGTERKRERLHWRCRNVELPVAQYHSKHLFRCSDKAATGRERLRTVRHGAFCARVQDHVLDASALYKVIVYYNTEHIIACRRSS